MEHKRLVPSAIIEQERAIERRRDDDQPFGVFVQLRIGRRFREGQPLRQSRESDSCRKRQQCPFGVAAGEGRTRLAPLVDTEPGMEQIVGAAAVEDRIEAPECSGQTYA